MNSLTPELRARIKGLFDAALDMEEPSRSAYLDKACADDPELGRAVHELQQGRGPSKGFLGDETTVDLTPVFQPQQVVSGRFRIIRFHGRGGMGEVYEAWDERLRLRVGLKTIRRGLADKDALQRFEREIRVAREVSHPNLCRVYDLLEHAEPDDGTGHTQVVTCLTMEWLNGETLQELLRRSRPLSTDHALAIIRQVASALDALHGANIVHRDLKPGNIMLVPVVGGGERTVVMDFGLAKQLAGGKEWFESNVDVQAGAPYFMAPEQLRSEKPTAASDVYALGLVIDEMVTTSRAFNAGSLGALYFQRLWENPISPEARSTALPANWNRAILRCLETEPSARYASAGQVLVDLEGSRATPVLPRMRSWNRLWPVVAALLILIGSILFASHPPELAATMVVFQIEDLTSDPAYAGLSAGMTADLVSKLAKVEGLSVRRFYSVRSKATLSSITDRFQLDGDLQRYQSRIRLNMRLVDSSKGDRIVWSDSFDRNLEDPLDLQNEIAGRVVNGLEGRTLSEATELVRVRYAGFHAFQSLRGLFVAAQAHDAAAPSPAAYHAYLRGRQLSDDRDPSSVEAAIQLYQQAIAAAPKYAVAHAALADAYRAQIDGRRGLQQDLLQKARDSALLAVRLDPHSPEAYTALAGVQQMEWDWAGAESSYRKAISLDDNWPIAYRRYGGLLMQFGRFDEALALVRKGLELDPYDYPSQAAYGFCLHLARMLEEAEKQLKWTLEQKDFITAHNNLGLLYIDIGKRAQGQERDQYFDLALKETETVRAFEIHGKAEGAAVTPVSDYMFALAYAAKGDRGAAHQALARLEALQQIGRVSPASLAIVRAALDEREQAVSYLRAAAQIKDRKLLYLKVESLWDPIRDTEGFKEVLSLMKL